MLNCITRVGSLRVPLFTKELYFIGEFEPELLAIS